MYYYLLSSLPYLLENADNLPSLEDFSAICRDQLTPNDYAVLVNAVYGDYETFAGIHPFLARFSETEKSLRNEIAKERSRKTGLSCEGYDSGGASWHRDKVIQAVGAESPLTGENILLGLRMELISELEAGRFFEFENVLAYYLKLQLLHRKKRMNRERGLQSFETAYQTISAPLNEESGLSFGV